MNDILINNQFIKFIIDLGSKLMEGNYHIVLYTTQTAPKVLYNTAKEFFYILIQTVRKNIFL